MPHWKRSRYRQILQTLPSEITLLKIEWQINEFYLNFIQKWSRYSNKIDLTFPVASVIDFYIGQGL
jgi:hypothetical protein